MQITHPEHRRGADEEAGPEGEAAARADASSAPARRYWAFISYSHRDERWAAWLHRKLEGYDGHAKIAASASGEPLPKRLFPVFRDRDELAGAPDLSERIQEALRESRFLIVVCSPAAAKSRWVNEEIKAFKTLGGEARVLAFIVAGEPNASDSGVAQAEEECFPEALRYRVDGGALTGERTEPIAADARKGKDGSQHALLKLVAGILGVRFDELRRRDLERAARRRNVIAGVSAALALGFAGIAGYAWRQQLIAQERSRIALSRQLAAQAANELPGAPGSAGRADYALGLLLAVQAFDTRPTIEARAVLLRSVLASPHRLQYLWHHESAISGIAFAPDGGTLASAGADGAVVLWDTGAGRVLGTLAGTPVGANAVAFNLRGDMLATAGDDAQVRLWDPASRRPLGAPLAGAQQPLRALAFAPDGSSLAAGGGGEVVRWGELVVWNLADRGHPRVPADAAAATVHAQPITAVAYSPDGRTLASASADGVLVLRDAANLQVKRQAEGYPFTSIAFSRDGSILASGGHSRIGTRSIVKLPYGLVAWDMASGSPHPIAPPQEADDIGSVAFGEGRLLATGGLDGQLSLWTGVGQEQAASQRLPGHRVNLTSVQFSPDSRRLASADAEGRLILRDLDQGAPLQRVLSESTGQAAAGRNPFYMIQGLAVSGDAKMLASEGPGGKVIVWDAAAGVPQRELAARPSQELSLAFAPGGKTLVADTSDGLRLWDAASGEPLGAPISHLGRVDARSFSDDGKLVALAMPDRSVVLWDIAARAAAGAALTGLASEPIGLAFSPDGKRLAAAGKDGSVLVWDVAKRQALGPPLTRHEGQIQGLVFDRKGTLLCVAAWRENRSTLTLWNLEHGRRVDLPLEQSIEPERPAFSPNGTLLVAALRSGELRAWDAASGRPLETPLAAHRKPVAAFAFAPEGDLLYSVDSSGTLIVWDLARRAPIGRLTLGYTEGLRSAVFSDDAKAMLSSSLWGSKLILTELDPDAWATSACRTANRTLTRSEWSRFVGAGSDYQPACAPPARR